MGVINRGSISVLLAVLAVVSTLFRRTRAPEPTPRTPAQNAEPASVEADQTEDLDDEDSLSLNQRFRDWFATSFLGLKLVVLFALLFTVPFAIIMLGGQAADHALGSSTHWASEAIKHPRPNSRVDQYFPYVIYGLIAFAALGLVLAFLRSIPRLMMVWILLHSVDHEAQTTRAQRRLSQFLVIPKGLGLMLLSGILGALLGLSISNAPEAHQIRNDLLTALASIFISLMIVTAFFLTHQITDDLSDMGQARRLEITENFLNTWTELFPDATRFGRVFLRPSRHLAFRFARNPSPVSALMLPTIAMTLVTLVIVRSWVSPLL
ncbi:hypothetical protein [Mycobacteroides abscessus]|uniref:hypothetical protein n=1 Tax=Mycobacteroides abscessus TaxID=36809 RepID=UPI0003632D9B|nr:hypothetical protein [Mycobacteroides abscessus]MBN7559870.1 hypothetical protein [Mycobacteroides abscessus subsp. abscessus]